MSETRVPLHEAEYVAWEKKGATARGIFLGIEDRGTGKGKVLRIQTKDGVVRCAAPMLLLRAVESVKAGTEIEITYTGQDAPKDKSKAGLKRFKVEAIETT